MPDFNNEYPEGSPELYRSWANFSLRKFSYSLAADIDKCGHYTKLSRFQGLAPILDNATFKFGNCAEKSVSEFYRLGADPVETFVAEWRKFEKVPLKYTDRDGSWFELNSVGKNLLKVFMKQKDTLPMFNPEFGVVIPRDLNATWYKGTRLEYIADVVSHPLDGDMLIDIKTSGSDYGEKAGMEGYAALDPQLLTGALVSGIRRVGFLALIKRVREPKVQFVQGIVTDELLEGHNEWLKDQYNKLVERRLFRNTGVRWPNERCKICDMLPKCLGNEELAARTLRQKVSKQVAESLVSLDEL